MELSSKSADRKGRNVRLDGVGFTDVLTHPEFKIERVG